MRGLPYPSRVLNSHHPGESLLLLYPLAISPIKPGRGREWLGFLPIWNDPPPSALPHAPALLLR
jgi:hypothetical protein